MAVLAEVRAALAAGAGPAAVVAAVDVRGHMGLETAARALRVGAALTAVAAEAQGPHAVLLRGLAVAEEAGGGALAALERVLAGAAEQRRLDRALAVRTAQARGTATVLTLLPLVAWAVLAATRPGSLAFYATPVGAASLVAAGVLLAAGRWCISRLVAGAARAAAAADPLSQPATRDARALAAVALPVLGMTAVLGGTALRVAAAAAAAVVLARARRGVGTAAGLPGTPAPDAVPRPVAAAAAGLRRGSGVVVAAGSTAETVGLLAAALESGLAPVAALEVVGRVAVPAARPWLRQAARRLRHGWPAASAFAHGPLARVGAVLAVAERWGAPVAADLHRLAVELREEARAAAELAAERVSLRLVFPTTLLVVPAFVALVVPPPVWAALRSFAPAGP